VVEDVGVVEIEEDTAAEVKTKGEDDTVLLLGLAVVETEVEGLGVDPSVASATGIPEVEIVVEVVVVADTDDNVIRPAGNGEAGNPEGIDDPVDAGDVHGATTVLVTVNVTVTVTTSAAPAMGVDVGTETGLDWDPPKGREEVANPKGEVVELLCVDVEVVSVLVGVGNGVETGLGRLKAKTDVEDVLPI